MTIESTATITPDDADAAGRLLLALAEARKGAHIHTTGVEYAFRTMMPSEIETVGNALLALGNDTDAIIAPAVPEPAFKTARTVADVEDMPAYIREHFEEQDRITGVWDETPDPKDFNMFKTVRNTKPDPEADPSETATVYITKDSLHGWTFRAHYEGGEVTKLFETLEDGLREHSGDILYFTEPEPDRYEVRALRNTTAGVFYRVWSNSEGRYMDGSFRSQETAETWKLTLERAEGVPECDLSPESVFEIEPLHADLVGEFLQQLTSTSVEGSEFVTKTFLRKVHRGIVEQVGDALRELAEDPSTMIVQKELEL
jgi:hypothetical protein